MKRTFTKHMAIAVVVLAALTTVIANAFAALPCMGAYYEPEMPESLKR